MAHCCYCGSLHEVARCGCGSCGQPAGGSAMLEMRASWCWRAGGQWLTPHMSLQPRDDDEDDEVRACQVSKTEAIRAGPLYFAHPSPPTNPSSKSPTEGGRGGRSSMSSAVRPVRRPASPRADGRCTRRQRGDDCKVALIRHCHSALLQVPFFFQVVISCVPPRLGGCRFCTASRPRVDELRRSQTGIVHSMDHYDDDEMDGWLVVHFWRFNPLANARRRVWRCLISIFLGCSG